MRSARQVRLTPVDEATGYETTASAQRGYDVVPNPDGAAEARTIRNLMRRERSSAYWFAAAKWGMGGLLTGMIMGASLMYVAAFGAIPLATDAVARGTAIGQASQALQGGSR